MPLIPERLAARSEVRSALDAQFWEQAVASARSLDGVARTAPADPPPLGQLTPQGASRPQQLLIIQAGVGPVSPGYDASNGGVFIDRVLACTGSSRRWWAALTGRARVQRLAEAHMAGAPLSVALADASAYGLAARGRLALGRGAAVSGVVEVPDARWLPSPAGLSDAAWWGGGGGGRSRGGGRDDAATAAGPSPSVADLPAPPSPSPRSSSSYGSAGSAGAPASPASPAARGRRRRSRGGGGSGAGQPQPRQAPASASLPPPTPSAAAAALAARRGGIPADLLPRGSAKLTARLPGGHEAALTAAAGCDYVDAAAATARVPLVIAADVRARPRADGIQYRVGVHRVWAPDPSAACAGEEDGGDGGAWSPSAAAAARKPSLRSVAHVQGAVAVEGEATVWRPAPRRGWRAGAAGPPKGEAGGGEPRSAPATAAETTTAATATPPSPQLTLPSSPAVSADPLAAAVGADWVVDLEAGGDGGAGGSVTRGPGATAPAAAAALRARVAAAATAARAARAATARLEAALRAGPLSGGGPAPAPRTLRARKPYLPGLGPPRLALTGAVGCLGRMPLPDGLLEAGGRGSGAAAAPAPALGRRASPARARPSSSASPPRPPPIRTGGGQAAPAPASRRPWWCPSLPRALDADAWAPCVRDTALRVFASAGAAAQLGSFSRPLADYTYASVRLDLGLTAPGGGAGTGAASSTTPRGGGAFALEGRGVWHALSASVCQQVLGPLRVRADARLALESSAGAGGGGGGGGGGSGGPTSTATSARTSSRARGPPPAAPATPPGAKGAAAAWGGAAAAAAAAATSPPARLAAGTGGRGRPASAAGTAREALREAAARGWAAARAARPTLLETAYGADFVLPGTEGTLRLVGWWSPARREGMVELRLL